MAPNEIDVPGQRGPQGHEMREKILRAAEERFAHYGYDKTTIGDIAKDLKISTAYVYKFFDSKLAINEAVAVDVLARIGTSLHKIASKGSAAERLRGVYRTLLDESLQLFFEDRKLHDMVINAIENDWCAIARHKEGIGDVVRDVIRFGRTSGEFETVTREDAVVDAVCSTLGAFANPHVLEKTIDMDLKTIANTLADVMIRGLRA